MRRILGGFALRGVAADSVLIFASHGATAITGVVFWAIAARMMTPESLGVDTALLSIIITTATVAAVGTGNSFTALLPVHGCDKRRRLLDGYIIVATKAVVLGVGAGIIAAMTHHLGFLEAFCWTVIGTVITAFWMVKDQALVSLGAATKLPFQNFVASIAKLALFPLFLLMAGHPAVLATLVASAGSAAVVCLRIIPRILAKDASPAIESSGPSRREMAVFAARDGLGNAATTVIFTGLPFITTALAGPVDGAVLALALTVATPLGLLSSSVGIALTTSLAAFSEHFWHRVRRVWLITQLAVLVCGAAIVAAGPLIVGAIGAQYRQQPIILTLTILVVGMAGWGPFSIWMSVLRSRRMTGTLMAINIGGTVIGLPLIVACTKQWGAVGAAVGFTATSAFFATLSVLGLLSRGKVAMTGTRP